MTCSSPITRQAEHLFHVHGLRGEDPTEPPAERPLSASAGQRTSRASRNSPRPGGARACTRSTCRSAHLIEENDDGRNPARIRPACAAIPSTAIPASPTARPTRRSSASIPRCGPSKPDAADRRLCRAAGRPMPAGGTRRRRRGRRSRAQRESLPPISSWSPAAPCRRRCCSCARPATPIPHGLANGSGQVGRNYMRHNNATVLAISRKPNPTEFQKTLALNDFYHFGCRPTTGNFRSAISRWSASRTARRSSSKRCRPRCSGCRNSRSTGSPAIRSISGSPREDLPQPENRIYYRGRRGRSRSRPTQYGSAQRLRDKLRAILRQGRHPPRI